MVSDDKDNLYKNLKGKKNSPETDRFIKPSNKFATLPSSEKINLYNAICSDCHSEVKVNFQPLTTEPFYCDHCFATHRFHHHTDKK